MVTPQSGMGAGVVGGTAILQNGLFLFFILVAKGIDTTEDEKHS